MPTPAPGPSSSSGGSGGADMGPIIGAVVGVFLLLAVGALWFYRRHKGSEAKPSALERLDSPPNLMPLKALPEGEATVLSVAPEAEETLPAQPPPATGWFAAEPELASFAPEASSLPPGHVSGAEAAMMAAGEPPPQPRSWSSGAAPEPEPEFEPEPEC